MHTNRLLKEITACFLIISAALIIYLQMLNFGLAINEHTINYFHFRNSLKAHGFIHTIVKPPDHFSYWVPVTYLSYASDFVLWGNDPGRQHLSAVFYHIINGLLLFVLLKKMTKKVWTSVFAALLLIVHPLNVEAVIYTHSNTLSTFFAILGLVVYVDYVKTPGLIRYLLVVICFVLSLMAKPSIVLFPIILLIIDYWPLNRFSPDLKIDNISKARPDSTPFKLKTPAAISLQLLKEKIPFFLLAVVCVLGNIWYSHTYYMKSDYFQTCVFPNLSASLQKLIGSSHAPTILFQQLPRAAVSYLGYLWKAIWPVHLSWYLPTPPIEPYAWWETTGALLLLVMITTLSIRYRRRAPYLTVGWLWYLIIIFPPVINNTLLGNFITSHYAYMPMIGLYLMVTWGGESLWERNKIKKPALAAVAVIIVIVLIIMSYKQTSYWKNPFTLYEHALSIEPESPFLHTNMGKALYEHGKTDAAIKHLEQALQAKPDSSTILTNLGIAYFAADKIDKAEACLKKANTVDPGDVIPAKKLADLYRASGNFQKAADMYKKLLNQRPDCSASICYNLACLYAVQNKKETAVAWLEKSIACGFNRIKLLKNDEQMKNIKDTEYYQTLINNPDFSKIRKAIVE